MEEKRPIEFQHKQDSQPGKKDNQRERRVLSPTADIFENDTEIIVVADVPGADENSVEIILDKNVLTVNASTDIFTAEKHNPVYAEYAMGDYQRRFVLSNQVDREKIEAVVKNGVLTLHLPKAAEAQSRKIPVKAG